MLTERLQHNIPKLVGGGSITKVDEPGELLLALLVGPLSRWKCDPTLAVALMQHQVAEDESAREGCREEPFQATLLVRSPIANNDLSMPAVFRGGFRFLHLRTSPSS